MNPSTHRRWPPRAAAAVLAALAAVAALALVPSALASTERGPFDRAFLTEMISHHAMAVEMAEMAEEKATHPELQAAAKEIVAAQSSEIERMRRWLRAWYGIRARPMMHHHMQRHLHRIDRASGAEFEVRFLVMMSVHHQQAIDRSEAALARAGHPRVREFARAIIRAQSKEIRQFEEWLVAWYATPAS